MPFSPLDWLDDELERLNRHGLRRHLVERASPQDKEVLLAGQRLVNFGANDYLGLANHPDLAKAARECLTEEGWGSGASPLVSGRSSTHAALERELAQFEQTEAALLFPSGFAANAGTIPALVGEGDAIFADATNHASLIDGCRLTKAERWIYRHNDWRHLDELLATTGPYRRRLIVTDSLFSMDGDLAPLVEIGQLAEAYDAMLLVDEAHATGVFGEQGGGVVEHFSVTAPRLRQQVTIRIGTLSKALGASGGFVAGSQRLIDWLANAARSYVFSTAPPAASAAAARAALRLVQQEPQRRQVLLERAKDFRLALAERGWDLAGSASQIVPIVVGPAERTMQLAAQLREAGFFVPGIRPPTVPEGASRLRISLSYAHREESVARLTEFLISDF